MVFQTLTMPGKLMNGAGSDPSLEEREILLDEKWPKMAFVVGRSDQLVSAQCIVCRSHAPLEALRAADEPLPLVFTSTNKIYGGLEDIALNSDGGILLSDGGAVRANGIDEPPTAPSTQPLRLCQRCRRPIYHRLRSEVWPACGGISHELHLRISSDR